MQIVPPTIVEQIISQLLKRDILTAWLPANHLRPEAADVAQAFATSLKHVCQGDPKALDTARQGFLDALAGTSLSKSAGPIFDIAASEAMTYAAMVAAGLPESIVPKFAQCSPAIEAIRTIMLSLGAYPSKKGWPYGVLVKMFRSIPYLTGGPISYDIMREAICVGGKELNDAMIGAIEERLWDYCEVEFPRERVRHALEQVAFERHFHPVADYLNGLVWDGVSRIEAVLCKALGIASTPWHRRLLRKWMLSAVARALRPGCKVDFVLILHCGQGARKSTFFQTLTGDEFFVDTAIKFHDKDALLTLRQAWILELAELKSILHARDDNAAKSFITSSTDTFRRPYGHRPTKAPRHCIIVGTTNDTEFLTDITGNRRYPVIDVSGEIDIESVALHRDQLWAEATAYFKAGEEYWLNKEDEVEIVATQSGHTRDDPWTEDLLTALSRVVEELKNSSELARKEGIGLDMIIAKANVLKEHQILTSGDYQRAAKIVSHLGKWHKHDVRLQATGRTAKRWFPPA
jgi:hypothetical protein